MKRFIFYIMATFPILAFSQYLDTSKYQNIVKTFSTEKAVSLYLYKNDTLVTFSSGGNKRYIVAPSFNYYSTNGKVKIEVKSMQKDAVVDNNVVDYKILRKEIYAVGKLIINSTVEKEVFPQLNKHKPMVKLVGVDDTKISFNPNGTKIFLYPDPIYKGKPLILDGEGEYDFAVVMKTWNNTISSAKIPKGYSITFYDERQKDGGELPISGEVQTTNTKGLLVPNFKKFTCSYGSPNLSDNDFGAKKTVDFDNKISFIEVVKL